MAATDRVMISREGVEGVPSMGKAALAGAANVRRGWLLGRNSLGYVVPFTATTGLTSAGIAYSDADNTLGNDGDVEINTIEGSVDVDMGTAGDAFTDADIGLVAYGIDNCTVGKTDGSSTRSPAGIFLGLNSDTQKARVLVGRVAAALADGIATVATPVPTVQAGTGTLVAGVLAVAADVTITANSRIIATRKTPAGTMGVELVALAAERTVGVPGTGAFKITSVASDKTEATSDTSTIDWIIVG